MNKMRFYVTDGPLATTMSEVQEDYFRECLAAGAGGVRVVLRDGSTDLMAGSRYLEPGTAVRAEVSDGQLQVIYLGATLQTYGDWVEYFDITWGDDPMGA